MRVKNGSIGIGITNHVNGDLLTRSFLKPSRTFQTVYLPVPSYRDTGLLIVQNGDAGVSEFEIRGIKLIRKDPLAPASCPEPGPTEEMLASALSLPLDQLTPEAAAVVSNVGNAVVGRSVPKAWAYIGKLDLRECRMAGGGWVAVELRVKTGSIGVGILNRLEDDFLIRRFVKATEGIQVVFLPVQSYREAGGLVVQNGKRDISSEVEIRTMKLTFTISRLRLARARRTPPITMASPRGTHPPLEKVRLIVDLMT